MATGQGMNDSSPIEGRLRSIMHSWAMPIAPKCEHMLGEMIRSAAQRIERDGLTENPSKLWEVETNFRKILTEMTREAGASGHHEIQDVTFSQVLSRICPIWPFC